jgi:hypothetical protein
VEIANGAIVMLILNAAEAAPPELSFTWTVNVNAPACDGFPVIVPLAGDKVTPLGSWPLMTDQV